MFAVARGTHKRHQPIPKGALKNPASRADSYVTPSPNGEHSVHASLAAIVPSSDTGYVVAFLCVFAAWLALSAWVVCSRVVHDLGVASVLRGPRSRLHRRAAERMAADASADPRVAGVLAEHVLEADSPRVLETAMDGSGTIKAWRRAEALKILVRAGHPVSIAALERALAGEDGEIAAAAVTILGDIEDEHAASALVRALQAEACSPAWIAAQLDDQAVPNAHLLRPLLRDPKPAVRAWAARLLARSGGQDESLERELAELCRDPDADVRAAAVQALGGVGGDAAAEQACALLADPVWYVKVRAARALGQLGRAEHAQPIAELLADTQWWVRAAAKDALLALGPGVMEELIPLLDHPDEFARNGTAEVLQNLGLIDSLVAEVGALRPGSPAALAVRALLRKILAAGGPRLSKALLARAEPEARSQLERLVGDAELVPAEAA